MRQRSTINITGTLSRMKFSRIWRPLMTASSVRAATNARPGRRDICSGRHVRLSSVVSSQPMSSIMAGLIAYTFRTTEILLRMPSQSAGLNVSTGFCGAAGVREIAVVMAGALGSAIFGLQRVWAKHGIQDGVLNVQERSLVSRVTAALTRRGGGDDIFFEESILDILGSRIFWALTI